MSDKTSQRQRWLGVALAGAVLSAGCAGAQQPSADPVTAAVDSPVAAVEAADVDEGASAPETSADAAEAGGAPAARVTPDTTERARAEADRERRREAIVSAATRARRGDRASARTDLQQMLRDPEFGAYAAYNLGVIAAYEGQADQAQDYYRQALERDPGFGPAVVALVRGRLVEGDVAGAEQLVATQLRASNNAAGVRAAGLLVTLARERYEQVITDTRAIMTSQPENLDAHYALAMANLGLGRHELATYILQRGLGREAQRPDLYFGLARVALDRGQDQQARMYLTRALDVEPNHLEARVNLALLNLRARNFEEAARLLEGVTSLAPRYQEAWLALGNAYKGLQRFDEARQTFERAARLNDRYADPWFNLGLLYLDVDEFEGLDRIPRMERAIAMFTEFRNRAGGTVGADHPVHRHIADATQAIETQRELDARPTFTEPAAGGDGDGGEGDGGGGFDDFDFDFD